MFKDTVRQVVLGAALALIAGGAAQAQAMKGFVFKVIGPDGNPVVGAKVSLQDLSTAAIHFEGTTDGSGEFTQTGTTSNPKGFKFTVEVQGVEVVRLIRRGDSDLKHYDASNVPIISTRELNFITLDLRKAFSFEGTVTDKEGNKVANAKLTATDLDDPAKTFEARTDAKGRFELEDLPFSAQGFELKIEQAGKDPISQRLAVGQVGRLPLNIDLSKVVVQEAAKPNPAKQALESYEFGDYEGALPMAEEALLSEDADTSKAGLLIKGQCLDKLGRSEEALAAFEQYLPLDPENKDIAGVLARLAADAGDEKKAEKYTAKYKALGGTIVGESFNKGVQAFNAGDNANAAKYLEMAVKEDPKDAEAHKALAMTYARTGNYQGVVDHLKAYIKLKPNADDRGQWEAAIPTFEGMIKK